MKTKAELQKRPQQPVSTVNKNQQKHQDDKKNEKKPNVRTTDYKKMEEIILTDPDSLTHEEFLFFQSVVGYRRAIQLLNEGKRRKQLRKIDGTGKTVRNLQQNKGQEKTGSKEQKVIQKQKLSQVSQKSENEPIQKTESANDKSSTTSLPGNLKSSIEKEADLMGSKAESAGSKARIVQLKKLSHLKQEHKVVQRISQEEPMRNSENKPSNWDIKAGKYNRNVKEAQLMLINLGHKLPKYGANGKWYGSGETFNAITKFQKACKTIHDFVSKYGKKNSRKHIKHFQGIKPTGNLDIITFGALQKQINRKIRGPKVIVATTNRNIQNKAGMSGKLDKASNTDDIRKKYYPMYELGRIHNRVQAKAAKKYDLIYEMNVKGAGNIPGKTDGRADLVDLHTHEVWEIKSDTPNWNEFSGGVGRAQLNRYILASEQYGKFHLRTGNPRIVIEPFDDTAFGKSVKVFVRPGMWSFHNLEKGMIYYKIIYKMKPQNVPQEVPSEASEPEWYEIIAGFGLIIVFGAGTLALAIDDITGIGTADNALIGGTISGVAKGAQMAFGW